MSGFTNCNVGTSTWLTATGTVCITSAPAQLYGVLCHGTGTGGFQVFASVSGTTTNALSGPVWAYATVTGATVNAAVYFPFARDFPNGFSITSLPSADPKLTIFWSPTPGQ